ncbi:aspartic proteinase [Rhizopogon salebrosus TDB-379]|nr:aspartic proteinase [Rhizopogon salebrosus TDB-379]
MFPFAPLFATILLALSITGSPVVRNSLVTLPVARRLNLSGGTINLLQYDQARAAALKGRSASGDRLSGSISAINKNVFYIAQVGVGSPATTYNLIVDTGSSNTWVGANTTYVKTTTSVNTGQPVSVSYGSGFFSGTEYTDTVTLGSGLTIKQQSIGVANFSIGFAGYDGIIGIGPVDLTEHTLTDEPSMTIPTVTQNLHTQGIISENVVGVSFEPTNQLNVINGELTFGGADSTKYTGTIEYTSITTTSPASEFWGVDESITYGSKTILSKTSGIIDTGTTLILIASDAYSAYQSATGSTMDTQTNLLRITLTQYNALKNLNFNIGSSTFVLTPNGQIWPRSLNTYIGGSSSSVYLVVGDLGSPTGEGLDFVNGYAFLERFYSVFDTDNSRVGFATTSCTDSTLN